MTNLDRVTQTKETVEDYLALVTVDDFCEDVKQHAEAVRRFSIEELTQVLKEMLGDEGK